MEALGINLGLLIVQIIAFIIVFLTLNAWVYQPMLSMMESRKQKIAQGLEDARVAAEARADAEKEAAKVIADAQTEASKIAAERAQSSEVKVYAKEMATQHASSTSRLTAAARQAGIMPATPMLTPHMQQKLTELRNTSTTAFDERYVTLLKEAQERELRLHNAYARSGDNANLRAASSDTAKMVAQHLAEVQRISGSIVADRPAGS